MDPISRRDFFRRAGTDAVVVSVLASGVVPLLSAPIAHRGRQLRRTFENT
jgi:hypothetical protein